MNTTTSLFPARLARPVLLAALLAWCAVAQGQEATGWEAEKAVAPASGKLPVWRVAPDQPQLPVVQNWSPFQHCAGPEYPKSSLRNNEEGVVKASFLIAETGQVIDARVMKSSGFAALDQAAIRALLKCWFGPATLQGVPVKVWIGTSYHFALS
ncbi:energy transducer TonB [Massilia sp. CCM 8734]|uniref:energy transducer TonB n=1 Tax=Massilia sp. CCM 8734 TaxID=2609283 RepID=UPI0014219568|nr:energy transducer TonB [Massilia sp. CCM 8734]NHZ95556.1 TonB family protein [Massilia sp. CCM 8734]